MLFEALFGSSERRCAEALYRSAAEQARAPTFFRALGVPDTVDGRFDLLVLHVFLLLRRLRREGEAGRRLGQRLFDTMFDHFDQALREMGVGDLGVGRRIKAMGQAIYGRAAAYDRALETGQSALGSALARNLFAQTPTQTALGALTGYVLCAERLLAAQPAAALLKGRAVFPPAPEA
jgi:cytochrome b pre-mRNA-processing protein 3